MTDRRSFLARVTGALAGLVASKHVTIAEPKPAPKIYHGTLRSLEAGGQQVYPVNTAYTTPLPFSRTWVGGGFHGVTVGGRLVEDVWSVEETGKRFWPDGSFHGRVVSFKPIDGQVPFLTDGWTSEDCCEVRSSAGPSGWQEFEYEGRVHVGHWPEFANSGRYIPKISDRLR